MNDTIQKKIFAENLTNLLRDSGKTQAEVAGAIRVSPQTFNTWIRGVALPRIGKIQRLADYFGVGKSYLLDKHQDETPKLEITETEKEIIKAYRRLDGPQQELVLNMLGIKKDAESSSSQHTA